VFGGVPREAVHLQQQVGKRHLFLSVCVYVMTFMYICTLN
jgi:hypothetical protein